MASSKRLPNLGDILSPTLQPSKPENPTPGEDGNSQPARKRAGGRRQGENQNVEPPVGGHENSHHPANINIGGPPTIGTIQGDVSDLNKGKTPARRKQGGMEEEVLELDDDIQAFSCRGDGRILLPAKKIRG